MLGYNTTLGLVVLHVGNERTCICLFSVRAEKSRNCARRLYLIVYCSVFEAWYLNVLIGNGVRLIDRLTCSLVFLASVKFMTREM